MALIFPASPSQGQIYSPGGGIPAYIFNNGAWQANIPSIGPLYTFMASPSLTGNPLSITPLVDDNSTSIATTAYYIGQGSAVNPSMDGAVAIGTSFRWARADHVHPTDTSRAPVASPTFTGTVTIPAGAAVSGFALLASPVFTGTPTAPTAALDTSTFQLATTDFVTNQASTVLPLAPAAIGNPGVTGVSLRYARADHVHSTGLLPGYALLASAPVFTGTITAGSGQGRITLTPGGASNTGYLAFFNTAGVRQGIIGYAAASGTIQMWAEGTATGYTITSGLSVAGAVTGAGFAARFASPGPIGNVSASTGNFSTVTCNVVSATGLISAGTGITARADMLYGVSGTDRVLQWQGSNWYWYWEGANGNLSYQTPSGSFLYIRYAPDLLIYNALGPMGGNGAYINISDVRIKDKIEPHMIGLAEVLMLNPISFERTNTKFPTKRREVGFIAQEVREVIPDAVIVMGVELADGSGGMASKSPTLGIQSDVILASVVNAIKELNDDVTKREKMIWR